MYVLAALISPCCVMDKAPRVLILSTLCLKSLPARLRLAVVIYDSPYSPKTRFGADVKGAVVLSLSHSSSLAPPPPPLAFCLPRQSSPACAAFTN